MTRVLIFLLAALGVLPASAALAALIGLGVLRALPALQVGVAAALVLVLPMTGLWTLTGRQPASAVLALWGWSALLLIGLPGYFPGEIPGAVGTGLAVIVAPFGPSYTAAAARLGEFVARPVAQAPQGAAPAPAAERPLPDCVPVATALAGDQVALPYEGSGHSLAIPVQFGDVELPMLFDTGATVTTLDTAALRRLGVTVPDDAPEITLRTANGERTTRLVLVPRVWVGGLPVDGVTVGVCEECADERTSGLLGLNVSSQFLVTVDTARREVVFGARDGAQDRTIDVGPWLDIRATATLFPDTRVEVQVVADNRAERAVTEATVGLQCGDDRFVVRLADIAPGGTRTGTANLPRGTDCAEYRVALDRAAW